VKNEVGFIFREFVLGKLIAIIQEICFDESLMVGNQDYDFAKIAQVKDIMTA